MFGFKKKPTLRQELEALLDEVNRKRMNHEEDEHWARKQKEYYAERAVRIQAELKGIDTSKLTVKPYQISEEEIANRISKFNPSEMHAGFHKPEVV